MNRGPFPLAAGETEELSGADSQNCFRAWIARHDRTARIDEDRTLVHRCCDRLVVAAFHRSAQGASTDPLTQGVTLGGFGHPRAWAPQ